ncbi:MAG: hypothetical protein Kow0042_09070 [Calditrichia bacterium]
MKNVQLKTVVFIFILVISINLLAQEREGKKPKLGWQNNIVGSLNLTQTNFSNWAQGGENSFSWQFNLNAKFENNQEKYNWSNSGKLSYGRVKVGDADSRKSVDEIKVESVFTYKMNLYVNPYIAATGETQLTKGYQYADGGKTAISDYFDPAYFTQSAGLGYSPNEQIKTRLGAAIKETISDKYGYADDKSTAQEIEKSRVEVGAESVTDFSRKLAENILLTSKLELFSNMKALNQVDVRWDTILAAKVSRYVDVNFNVKLFYDRDISIKRQLKQALALGLTYTFL